jgi:hypothetical protein
MNLISMVESVLGTLMGLGIAAAGVVTLTLLTTKICPVCEHMFTKSVVHCPYCLHDFN